jgi:hypothetical protein
LNCIDLQCWPDDTTDVADFDTQDVVEPFWSDPATGLVWQTASGGGMSWAAGKDYCSSNKARLPGAGWHLPDIDELRSLIVGCPETELGGSCAIHADCEAACPDFLCRGCDDGGGPGPDGCYMDGRFENRCDFYWSATALPGSSSDAFDVDFSDGGVYYNGVGSAKGVRCVRAGP